MNTTAQPLGLSEIATLANQLVDFAERHIVNSTIGNSDERRSEDRYPMMVPVRAVRIDEDNQPIGEPYDLITRDLSSTAIGLLHCQRIEGDRLAIQFSISDTEVNLAISMIWSGPAGPFYGAAGRFVEKLDRFPG